MFEPVFVLFRAPPNDGLWMCLFEKGGRDHARKG